MNHPQIQKGTWLGLKRLKSHILCWMHESYSHKLHMAKFYVSQLLLILAPNQGHCKTCYPTFNHVHFEHGQRRSHQQSPRMYMYCLPHCGHMTMHLNLHATSLPICVCMGTCTCILNGEYMDVHQVLHIHSNAKTLVMVNWSRNASLQAPPSFLQSSWWSIHMLTMEVSSRKKNNWCHHLRVWTWKDYNPQRWYATSTQCMYKYLFTMHGGCGIHVRIIVPTGGHYIT